MSVLRRHLTYANLMVTILAFLLLGGGGAYAAKKLKLRNNSVTSPKIKDGEVTGPDLAAGAVGASQIALGAVDSSKIADGAVTGAKVADKSLDASDLADGVLGDQSVGRTDNAPGTCSPTAAGVDCSSVVLPMQRPGRVLVNADGGASYTVNNLVLGACQLTADGSGITYGVPLAGDGNPVTTDHFSATGVTEPLPAGTHTFALFCTETSTELSILDSHISAVSLSAD